MTATTGKGPGPHIVTSFDEELIGVQAKVSEMGGLAEDMLADCMDGLRRRDVALCEEVVRRDKRLDRLEAETEELVIQLLALRAPVALDLRLLVTCMRMAALLERVGDLSKNIARRGVELAAGRPQPMTASLSRMGDAARRQLAEALDAFTSRDAALAVAVRRRDVEIDELYDSLFREIVTYMMEDPRTITLGSHAMFIAKNLERIGDHATNIAELAYFLVEGEQLDEDRPRLPSAMAGREDDD